MRKFTKKRLFIPSRVVQQTSFQILLVVPMTGRLQIWIPEALLLVHLESLGTVLKRS